jgi:hypothetical protein
MQSTDTVMNPNAFASTFYFFSTHNATAEKNKKSLQATAPASADISGNLTRQTNKRKEERTDNNGSYPIRVLVVFEQNLPHQVFVSVDSVALRNPLLGIAATVMGYNKKKQCNYDTENQN